MCQNCEDSGQYENEVEFNSEFVDYIRELPEDEKEEAVSGMQEALGYVIDRVESEGFLFELITAWPRQKVAMYEAAVLMQKEFLDEGHNH